MLKANEISLVVACSSLSAICVCKGQRYANGYTVSYGTVSGLYHDHLLVFLLEYLYSNRLDGRVEIDGCNEGWQKVEMRVDLAELTNLGFCLAWKTAHLILKELG